MSLPSRHNLLKGALASVIFSPITSVQSSSYDELLYKCDYGIAACQEMSKSEDASEIRLAYDAVGVYGDILITIARNSTRLRGQALDLAARNALLRVILSRQRLPEA